VFCQARQVTARVDARTVQKKAAGTGGASSALPNVHDVLRSPGQPLERQTQAFMESRFGHDFSRVRIHADAQAAKSARQINAKAYTVGPDIVFAAGRYGPQTESGRLLLAHELAHVVQQGDQRGFQEKLTVSEPGDAGELEADRIAQDVMHGQPGRITSQKTGVMLQRNPDVGFTVHNMNIEEGKLDNPTDANGVVTWPLSFGVTSPIEVFPDVEVTGSTGDDCTTHTLGFLQTMHIHWAHVHYKGQSPGDGSSMMSFDAPLPIRDGEPGTMWYRADNVATPAACNEHIEPHMDDYPSLTDIPKVRTNSLTSKQNFLSYITRGVHFVTTLVDDGPSGVTPLRFFYWNYLMDISFKPNYANTTEAWPFTWSKNRGHADRVHKGGSSSVPLFTTASTAYREAVQTNIAEKS